MTLTPLPRPILDVIAHGDKRAIHWLETLIVDTINGINGIPGGGADGQALVKSSGADYAAQWQGVTNVPFLLPPVGEYLLTTTGPGGAAAATLAGAANRFEIYQYLPRADVTIDQLAVNCTTAVAAALGKIVVYASDANGQPDALILETGTLDFATTGPKTAPVTLNLLQYQTYWLGIRHSSTATLSAWATTAIPDINGGTAISTSARKTLRRTLTFATPAPDPWGFVSSEINPGPATAVFLRRA